MKPRDIAIFTLLFLAASVYALAVVLQTLTGLQLQLPRASALLPVKETPAAMAVCTDKPAIAGLEASSEPHLKKLAEYQEACRSFVTDQLMVFGDMPKDGPDAKRRAETMAATLLEFKKYGVHPLVIIEPVSDWGLVDFKEFGSGFYDPWIKLYFEELKAKGLSDADLGTWVPFPEANLPYWNNTNATPADYAADVNRYLHALKKEFPGAKGSVMLNSATYDSSDFNWENGEYVSLRDYVKGIDKGLVDSFGLQGFPWLPSARQVGAGIVDASEFLTYRLASEAADLLGTKNIWYNTGSFRSKYTLDSEKTVYLSPARRADILNGIIAEAKKLQSRGYSVTINLFAEDKSGVAEATDWSYWQPGTVASSPDTSVFTDFARQLNAQGFGLSLFDIAKE